MCEWKQVQSKCWFFPTGRHDSVTCQKNNNLLITHHEAVPATLTEKKTIYSSDLWSCQPQYEIMWVEHWVFNPHRPWIVLLFFLLTWQYKCRRVDLKQGLSEGIAYLREGVPAARSFVVFIGALELKVLPTNPPQHSSQLLLQLQFSAKKKIGKTPGGQIKEDSRTDERSHIKWVQAGSMSGLKLWLCFDSQWSLKHESFRGVSLLEKKACDIQQHWLNVAGRLVWLFGCVCFSAALYFFLLTKPPQNASRPALIATDVCTCVDACRFVCLYSIKCNCSISSAYAKGSFFCGLSWIQRSLLNYCWVVVSGIK